MRPPEETPRRSRRPARRALAAGLAGVTAYDLLQRRHAILRNRARGSPAASTRS